MKSGFVKLFVSADNNTLKSFEYSISGDYYSFVKDICLKGYKQVIITSDLMIPVLKEYFLVKKFKINDLQFMIEDTQLQQEIKHLLDKISIDRAYFNELLDKVTFLSEESTIDIRKIELSGRYPTGKAVRISLQVNGIIGISEGALDTELPELLMLIERCLK